MGRNGGAGGTKRVLNLGEVQLEFDGPPVTSRWMNSWRGETDGAIRLNN